MKKLLEFIVQSIVNHPEAVKVKESKEATGLVNLSLKVHSEDVGQVIGKKGKIIRAIRTLVYILAVKEGKRVNIEVG